MRISTQVFYQRNNDSLMKQQSKLSGQNAHMAAEKRVIHGSDDAVAISTIQRLKQDVSVGDQYIENGKMAETANALEETSLEQITNIMQGVREQLVTAGNGTYDDDGRDAIATVLEGYRNELIGVANTRDGNSQYIFAGYEVDTQPFQRNEFGTVDYHGDHGVLTYKVGAGVSVAGNDSGAAIFLDIAEGNGTFVSEGNIHNTGSGVIDESSIINNKVADLFVGEDYMISISQPTLADDPKYAVYGLKETAVTGDATIKVTEVDLSDTNIGNVNPAGMYPEITSEVNIEFFATAIPGEFSVQINGKSSLPVIYDSANPVAQTISIDGLSIEVDGIPDAGDQYSLTKYIEPTIYNEGQAIEFNGIKTELKGSVANLDSFTLRKSETKDIFSTIQDSIDTLRMPGNEDVDDAKREMRLDTARLQIDNAMDNISTIVTSVGSRRNTIQNQNAATQDFKLTSQKSLSNLEDLDLASAISEFKMQSNLLEISQTTYMQMQGLSLFNLL